MTGRLHVVESTDQRAILDDVLAAGSSERPCAVLDPTWPEPLRAAARAKLDSAHDAGRVDDGDLVVFTSGSTAAPRGVVRTVDSWRASAEPLSHLTGLTPEDVVWLPGPLWSSLFLYGAWHAATVGASTVLRDDDTRLATVVHCVPAQLPGVLDDVQAARLPRLRLAVVAGDRLADATRARAEAADVRVLEYYGAAELSFVAHRPRSGPLQCFPGVETQVREGLAWARSPYLARQYLSPDDDGPLRRDADGWATVGDLAVEGADGIEVLGRGDAAVTTGGHTVVVEEVERVLRCVPGVVDVAVVGVPHARLGQLVAAVVVGDATDAQLIAGSRTLPAPARPRRWLRAPELPRTAGGKLRRPELARLVATLTGR